AVASAVGGLTELIQDGVTGLLVPAGDAQALATALERLLSDTDLAAHLGAAARTRVDENFSLRQQVNRLLALWRQVIDRQQPAAGPAVIDSFGVTADSELPTLRLALDPVQVSKHLSQRVRRLRRTRSRLQSIQVLHYKPARRCLLEYELDVEESGLAPHRVSIIGKIRAQKSGKRSYRFQQALWRAGFAADSADGISVPEPLGVIPELQMCLQ